MDKAYGQCVHTGHRDIAYRRPHAWATFAAACVRCDRPGCMSSKPECAAPDSFPEWKGSFPPRSAGRAVIVARQEAARLSCLRAGSFEVGDQPLGCPLFDSDIALFELPQTPTGASAFANPRLFELDRAGDSATAMASPGDLRTAQGSNRPRKHYRLIVRPGSLTVQKPGKNIGNLFDFKEALCLSKFSLCEALVVADLPNPTEMEISYLYFPAHFRVTTDLVLKFLQDVVWVHSPTTSVHEGRLLRLTIPFKNGFPFVGQWAAEVEMKKYVAALQVHATKAERQLGSRDRKRTRTSGPAAAGGGGGGAGGGGGGGGGGGASSDPDMDVVSAKRTAQECLQLVVVLRNVVASTMARFQAKVTQFEAVMATQPEALGTVSLHAVEAWVRAQYCIVADLPVAGAEAVAQPTQGDGTATPADGQDVDVAPSARMFLSRNLQKPSSVAADAAVARVASAAASAIRHYHCQ